MTQSIDSSLSIKFEILYLQQNWVDKTEQKEGKKGFADFNNVMLKFI